MTDRIVTRQMLSEIGVDDDAIARHRGSGLISTVTAGVYVVGAPALTQRELWRAAMLTAGPRSALETTSAAEVRGLLSVRHGFATVTTQAPGPVRWIRTKLPMEGTTVPALIRVRYTSVRTPIELVAGLPATTVSRTLIDLAGSSRARFDRVWREAEFLRLLDIDDLRRELALTRRKGATVVKRKLLEYRPLPDTAELRTKLELAFFRIVDELGLPRPQTNVPVLLGGEPYVPDFLYEELGLAIEADGPHHLIPAIVRRDKARDIDFFIAGLDVLRFDDGAITDRPQETGAKFLAAYQRQVRRVARAA